MKAQANKLPEETDLIVIGSGAGGLTAALFARLYDLRVIVLEHTNYIGGTSARSSGTVWVPNNHLMRAKGFADDRLEAEAYLEALVGNRGDAQMWRAFLDKAPKMLVELEERIGVAFRPFMKAPDYRQELPGAAEGGRPLEPLLFDGRLLGEDFQRLASPLRELMLLGGMMITRVEAAELLRADRSPHAAWLGLKLVGRYLHDRMRNDRGTRLVLGNALIARLFFALKQHGVPVFTGTKVRSLLKNGCTIAGVECELGGDTLKIAALRGVVLAGGGFPASPELRAAYLPQPVAQYTPASEGCDGSSIRLGLKAGAELGPDTLDNGLWFPSSVCVRDDGTTAVYPHIVLDRAKPGALAVNAAGERFVNEAVSYHEFVRGMYRAQSAIPAWMICTRGFISRYGLGLIRPRTPSLRKFERSGYLKTGRTIEELAERIGVPSTALQNTIARFNAFALSGVDEDFHRGENVYERSNGDAGHGPNPCLGALDNGPFHAVALHPTPLGTSRGIAINVDAQALDANREPVPGLYACGNDAQSAFGGEYPGAGAQLGQAMTFGWLAARHAAATQIGKE